MSQIAFNKQDKPRTQKRTPTRDDVRFDNRVKFQSNSGLYDEDFSQTSHWWFYGG